MSYNVPSNADASPSFAVDPSTGLPTSTLDDVVTSIGSIGANRATNSSTYIALQNFTGATTGDHITRVIVLDTALNTIISDVWTNDNTGLVLVVIPIIGVDVDYITGGAITLNEFENAVPSLAQGTLLDAPAADGEQATSASHTSLLKAIFKKLLGTITISNTAFTANAGTNLNTSALALESGGKLENINNKIPAQGQALAAASMPVVLPSAQISALTTGADLTASGTITTQNLVPNGAATAGSAVVIATNSRGTMAIQVTGTYTGALSVQITNDDTNWITQSGGNFLQRMSDGANFSAIPSGSNDIFQLDVAAHAQVRVTALSAVTGAAVVTIRACQGNSLVTISEGPVNLDKYASIVGDLNFGFNTTLSAYTQALYRDDELWDTALIGGGTCTWTQAAGGCTMTVTNSGDAVIRESKLASQYLASAPQVWDLTAVDMSPVAGVVKQYGYFSSSTTTPFNTVYDGFVLETDDTQVYFKVYKGGSAIFSAAQSTWDDPLNGKGRSGILIDWTKFHALVGEFLYLGGTQADFGFLIGGSHYVLAHTFKNSNVNSTTFVHSPNQKLRYSIRRVSGTGAASTVQICSKVGSKGLNYQKVKIRDHLYSVGGVYTFQPPTIGTEYAWMGAKLNTRLALAWLSNVSFTSTSADDLIVRVRRSPTVSGAGLTYSAITHAPYSVGMAPTPAAPTITASGGKVVLEKVISATANQEFSFDADNLLLSLGQKIDGTFDELVITFEPITASLNIRGSITIDTNN